MLTKKQYDEAVSRLSDLNCGVLLLDLLLRELRTRPNRLRFYPQETPEKTVGLIFDLMVQNCNDLDFLLCQARKKNGPLA